MARPALAANRAIEIMNFLAAHPTEAFTLSDFVDRLGINVASLHAILAVLTESGYLSRHPRHRTYTLGPAVVAVGTAALEHHAVIEVARSEAQRLSKELDLDVAVTAPAGEEVVFVARSGTHHPRGKPSEVGMRSPLRPPLGSIFYAWADRRAVESWLARAESTSPEQRASDLALLDAVRARGYSVSLEVELQTELGYALEELTDRPQPRSRGAVDEVLAELRRHTNALVTIDPDATYDVSSIGAPVFDGNGNVVLAMNLIGPPPGLSGREVMAYGEAALDAGLVVSKRTRGKPPEDLMEGARIAR